jgi:Stress responsive A/B Barrel Domain
MAIEHLDFMKLQRPVPEEQLKAPYRECEASFDTIPGTLTASLGENWHPDESGFTHTIVIRLEDWKKLKLFMSHPPPGSRSRPAVRILGVSNSRLRNRAGPKVDMA